MDNSPDLTVNNHMRRIWLFSASVLLLGSFSLYAADTIAVGVSPAPLRMKPLSATIEGPEGDVLIELRERPLLDRPGIRVQSESASQTLDVLLDRLDADVRRIAGRPDKGPKPAAADSPLRFRYKLVFAGASAHVSREAVSAIRALPYVKAVHLDRKMEVHLTKSVPAIRAPEVWQTYGVKGKGVVVAVIDTGIDYKHAALGKIFPGGKVAGGYDFINQDDDPMDDNGHGTHVAGIIAGNEAPVIGVAPEATLLAYKVLDDKGAGKESTVIAGLERAMDPDGNGDPSDRADVVNMSLGGERSMDDPLVAAVERASAAGAVFCISAGNNFIQGSIGTPGIAPSAITVAALVTGKDQRASFSSRGPVAGTWETKPEVGAPGVSIVSAKRGGGTVSANGTSMAAPHVAGVAALILERHPDWTPAEVKAAIVSTAAVAYSSNTEQQDRASVVSAGGGRVDARAAIDATVLPSPAALTFGVLPKWNEAYTATRTVRLANRGTASETVTVTPPVLADGAKLSVTPESVTIAPGTAVELTFTLAFPAASPFPNDDSVSFTGRVELKTPGATLHVPWQIVNGPIVSVTLGGTDDAAIAAAPRRGSAVPWQEGPRRFGYLLSENESDVAIAIYFQPPNDGIGKLVIREEEGVVGYRQVTAAPEHAIHRIHIAGGDERGVPFSAQIGTNDVSSEITRQFLLWNAIFVDFSVFESQTREFYVSPLKSTILRIIEFVRKPDAKYATMYRILRGVDKDETLQALPGDWASQTVEYECLKPTCDVYVAPGAGSLGLFWAHGIGKGGSKWKLFLTPRVAEEWDFRAYVMVREETSPIDTRYGIQPWTYLSPAFRNAGGRISAAPFGRSTVADHFPPRSERPLEIGDGPPVLRTIFGVRKIEFEPYGAAIGESIGERITAVKGKLFDGDGNELFLEARNPGYYRGPKEDGRYRVLLTTDYGVAGRTGKLTQNSIYEKTRNTGIGTLTMLRVEDAGGNVTWTVPSGSAPRLTFAARHSS